MTDMPDEEKSLKEFAMEIIETHEFGTPEYRLAEHYLNDLAQPVAGGDAPKKFIPEIDFRQAKALLELFGGEPTAYTVYYDKNGHSGKGVYAYVTEYPEDGAWYLGETDQDARPSRKPKQPTPASGAGGDAELNRAIEAVEYSIRLKDLNKGWCDGLREEHLRLLISRAVKPTPASGALEALKKRPVSPTHPELFPKAEIFNDGWNQANDACIAALSPAAVKRDDAWQPIETAPRDGTRIIVRSTWFHHVTGTEIEDYAVIRFNGVWTLDHGYGEYRDFAKATHWMPMIAVAAESEAE